VPQLSFLAILLVAFGLLVTEWLRHDLVAILIIFALATALFAPVAVILAQALGHPPEPYVVTVAMAAVVSFLTPSGYHGNLLVYGPGGYHVTDCVWVGTPLTVLVALIVTWLAPRLWPQSCRAAPGSVDG
jgi:di/tricarboxylate transporter